MLALASLLLLAVGLPLHAAALPATAGAAASLRPADEAWDVTRHHRGAQITHMPGYEGKLASRHYGGYITVKRCTGRGAAVAGSTGLRGQGQGAVWQAYFRLCAPMRSAGRLCSDFLHQLHAGG